MAKYINKDIQELKKYAADLEKAFRHNASHSQKEGYWNGIQDALEGLYCTLPWLREDVKKEMRSRKS